MRARSFSHREIYTGIITSFWKNKNNLIKHQQSDAIFHYPEGKARNIGHLTELPVTESLGYEF